MSERALRLVVVALAVGAVAAPVAGQSDGLTVSATADSVEPGGEVVVTFETTNTGDDPTAAIVNVTARPDWEVANRSDAGGLWRDSGEWLFQTVDAGETATPTLWLSVPADAGGEYTVAATATDGDTTATTETTIQVAESSTGGGLADVPLTTVGLACAGLGVVVLLGVLFVEGQ